MTSSSSYHGCLHPMISYSVIWLARKLKLGLSIGAQEQRIWTRGFASYIEMTGHPVCVKHAEYLCVTFGKKVILKIHIEMIQSQRPQNVCAASCSVFRSERPSNDIDVVQGCHLVCYDLRLPLPGNLRQTAFFWNLRRLPSDVHRTVGNFLRRTANRDLRVDF